MRALNREDFPRAASRAQGRVPDCRPAAPRRRTGSPCPPAGLHFYPSRTSSLVSSNCLRAFTFLLLARGVHGTIRTGPRWLRHGQHSPPDRREKQGRSGPNAPGRSQGGGTCRRQRRTSFPKKQPPKKQGGGTARSGWGNFCLVPAPSPPSPISELPAHPRVWQR